MMTQKRKKTQKNAFQIGIDCRVIMLLQLSLLNTKNIKLLKMMTF
jgi:hypothetical protein